MQIQTSQLLEKLADADDIDVSVKNFFLSRGPGIIYGAGQQAQIVMHLANIFSKKITCFLKTTATAWDFDQHNPCSSLPQYIVSELPDSFDRNGEIIIAVNEKHNQKIIHTLKENNFYNYYASSDWNKTNNKILSLYKEAYSTYISQKNNGLYIINQGSVEAFRKFPMLIFWNITEMCNYRCRYCFYPNNDHKKINQKLLLSYDKLKKIVDKIAALDRDQFILHFIGGEPTVHKNLIEIIHYAKEQIKERFTGFEITSNASRSIEYYKTLSDFALQNNMACKFFFSVHSEFADIKHIVQIVNALSRDARIYCRVMYDTAQRVISQENTRILFELQQTTPFQIAVSKLLAPPFFTAYDPNLTSDDESFIATYNGLSEAREKDFALPDDTYSLMYTLSNGNTEALSSVCRPMPASLQHERSQYFYNMYCIGGLVNIKIHPFGDVSILTCEDQHFIGNMTNDCFNPESIYKIKKCNHVQCTCLLDYFVPKFAERKAALEYIDYKRARPNALR
ncbi:radical SAM protein [Desulfovibrio sp. OttesenSCG-928-M16]|nr:radical SAM protein [Desulfovibrio sp. OttesenSCG-928-M16]